MEHLPDVFPRGLKGNSIPFGNILYCDQPFHHSRSDPAFLPLFGHLQQKSAIATQDISYDADFLCFRKGDAFLPHRNCPLSHPARLRKLGLGHFPIDPQFLDEIYRDRLLSLFR